MILVFKMALRNLRGALRKSIITVTLASLSIAVILWVQCILRGQNASVIETVTSTFVGKMQVFHPQYNQDHLLRFTLPEALPDPLLHLPKDVSVTRRVYVPALVSSGEQSLPIQLVGIDPEAESKVTEIKKYLKTGNFLTAGAKDCQEKQALIGTPAAQMLGVGLGDKVVILAQAADGTLGNDLLRVKGIFDSESRDFDKSLVYTTLDCAQRIAAVQGVHEYTLRIPHEDDVPVLRHSIQTALGSQYQVQTWKETLPRVGALVQYNDAMVILIGGMLYVVIALGMVNALLIHVFERTQEFGVMTALGTPPPRVVAMILVESGLLGFISIVIGTTLGLAWVAYHTWKGFDLTPFIGKNMEVGSFKMVPLIYPEFRWIPFLEAIFSTFLVVCLAAVYPAIRAARMNPIEAIRG